MAVRVNLREEEEERERNRQSNRAWIDAYVEWLRRTPNHEWSRQQRRLIDSVLSSARSAQKGRKVEKKP